MVACRRYALFLSCGPFRSIARFDPVSSWPTNLAFTVSVNPELTSWDGLSVTNTPTRSYTTSALYISLGDVTSAIAAAATANHWSATLAPLVTGAAECPPDVVLQLSFSHDVDVALVSAALVLQGANAGSTITVSACDSGSTSCVAVRPRGLNVGQTASLTLPAGTIYHAACGPTATAFSQPITGLVPFAFPFTYTSTPTWASTMYRRLRLWLRHGLASGTSLSALQSAVTLTASGSSTHVPFTLSLTDAGTLQLAAELMPNTVYSVAVAASATVTDAFGLSLQVQ